VLRNVFGMGFLKQNVQQFETGVLEMQHMVAGNYILPAFVEGKMLWSEKLVKI
jgi:hypothetical protein